MKVVNDRWGKGASCHHGGYYTCSDRYNPGHLVTHKWENCFTVRQMPLKIISVECFFPLQIDKHSWGFLRTSGINDYLTIQEILSQVITTVRLVYFSQFK